MISEEIQKNMLKSNTSIVGIVCKDGVVMAADRRSTAGSMIMNKDSKKIRKVNDYIVASYTGGVADIQLTSKIIAGVDEDGKCSLYTIEPAGGINEVSDYDANFSSGMPYILGLLEREFKKDMSVEEGIELAKSCIKSSTQRDSGSGNGIDVFSITKSGIKQVVSEEIKPLYQ